MTSPKSGTAVGVHRLYAIEAARGVASGGVLLFHGLAPFSRSDLHPVMRAIQPLVQPGWLGVDIFFVLSGWCIAERLSAARRRNESAGVFLRERVLRIFPTYWAALALTLITRLVAVPINHTTVAHTLPATALGWIGDLLLINPYLDVPSSITVSWTLVFELGFYGIASGVLMLGRRTPPATALVFFGLLLCLWPQLQWHMKLTYVLERWPEFFIGVLGWWCAQANTTKVRCGRASLLGLMLLLTLFAPLGYGATGQFVAVGTAAILWIFSTQNRHSVVNQLLRPLGWIGGFSYSLYLIHLAVLSPFLNLSKRFVLPSQPLFCVVWLAAIVLSLAAGWSLHHWVEAPVERWRKHRFAPVRPPRTASI